MEHASKGEGLNGDERATPRLLEAVFANAPLGLAAWDADLRYRRINAPLAEMNGLPVEAHLGRRPSELLPELGPRLEEMLQRILDTGEALHDVDVTGETPALPGVERHWVASYVPVYDDDGTPLGVSASVAEVTTEREASARAYEAQRRSGFVDAQLRAVYSALPLGVGFLTPDLRYQRVNETLAQMNGVPVEAHIGRSIGEILGAEAARVEPLLRQVMDTGESTQVQLDVPGEDGEARAFEATYFPVFGPDGEGLGVGAVVRDVSEQRAVEVDRSDLLRDALTARAEAEAARVRAEDAQEEAERARAGAEAASRRTAFLAWAGREMASSMEYETTLATVVRSTVPALADWCSLTLIEPSGELRVLALAHSDPERERLAWELVENYPAGDEPGTAAHVIRTGEPMVMTDIPEELIEQAATDDRHLELLRNLRLRHYMVAPLKTPQGVIGALTLVLGESERRFTDDDLDMARALASRAALHITNSRLYGERSHIAATLQASLFPRDLPSIPGVQLATRFRAAGDQNEVGGDFYDVFPSGDGKWTAIVGDVAGKGAEAAALTSLARHTLRTVSLLNEDPTENLALLNDVLLREGREIRFLTVIYARLCPNEEGLLVRFANGGHPNPLLLRADGEVSLVESGRGPLVGGMPGVSFEEDELQLVPGDLLLFYTDGVTEVRASDPYFGERDLVETMAERAGWSAEDVVEAVERRAVDLQDGEPRDDIAVLAIQLPRHA